MRHSRDSYIELPFDSKQFDKGAYGAIEAAFAGLARGGASRQVAAASVAALLRTVSSAQCSELRARMTAIEPVVRAGMGGQRVSGEARARRNLATHAFGVSITDLGWGQAWAWQRGGRRLSSSSPPGGCEGAEDGVRFQPR